MREVLVPVSAAAIALLGSEPAFARDRLPLIGQPAAAGAVPLRFAVNFEIKLRLGDTRNLVDSLVGSGIKSDDASAAAQLAAENVADASAGCSVKASVTRAPGEREFTIQRVTVTTATSQVVVERRGGKLALATSGASPSSKTPAIV